LFTYLRRSFTRFLLKTAPQVLIIFLIKWAPEWLRLVMPNPSANFPILFCLPTGVCRKTVSDCAMPIGAIYADAMLGIACDYVRARVAKAVAVTGIGNRYLRRSFVDKRLR
jgi:hypothetical protein